MNERMKKVILLALNYIQANIGDVNDFHEDHPINDWENDQLPTVDEMDTIIGQFSAPEKVLTMQECAKEALQCQNACNLSGVLYSFARVMHGVSAYAFDHNKGTEWKNTHPIVTVFLDKLNSLNRNTGDAMNVIHHMDACEAIAAGMGGNWL